MDKINKNQIGMYNPKDFLTGTENKKDTNMPVPVKNLSAQVKKYKVARNTPAQNKPGNVTGKKQDKIPTPATKKANKITGVQLAGVLRTVNGIRKDVGKLYLLEGAKKDIGSVKKEYCKLKNAMALLAAKSDTEENKEENGHSTNEVLGYAEATAAVAKIYVKLYMSQARVPVRLTKDAIKIIKVIRKRKAESVALSITKKQNRAPKIKSAERPQSAINTSLSAIDTEKMAKMLPDNIVDSIDGLTVIELPPNIPLMLETLSDALPVLDMFTDHVLKGNAELIQLPTGTEVPVDTGTDVMPLGRESSIYTEPGIEYSFTAIDSTGVEVTIDVLPADYKFDVSALEEKYGIHGSTRNVEGIRVINSDVYGVKPGKGTEIKAVDHTPKKITEPGKAEKIKEAEKKYGIKSKNNKDNLDKSKKEKKGKKKNKKDHKESVAKREFKKYIVEQLLLNDGDKNCSSGVEVLVANILNGKSSEILQRILSGISELLKKGAKKLLKWVILGTFYLIKTILQLLFTAITALIGLIGLPVVMIVCLGIGFVLLISGMFLSFVESGQFAVTTIDAHVSAIMEEAENYDEVNFHPYDEGRYSNYDDILLVYLSRIADLEDDANLEGEAPLLWIDKRAERRAINAALESMFYYETSTRTERRTVAVTVTCTPAPIPDPATAPGAGNGNNRPQYTVIYKTVTDKITVMDIYIKSADEYMATVSKRSILENYEILKDVFTELGYEAFGGTAVCDVYGIDYDSSE